MKKTIIGIDEVGRGPLAGPVTVTATCIRDISAFKRETKTLFLRDSKKLSELHRDKWFAIIKKMEKEGIVKYATVHIYPKTIDAINISAAANKAATQALQKVLKKIKVSSSQVLVLLDGGLFIEKNQKKFLKIKTKTIIKGDEKIKEISLASIIAKVTRDAYMRTLDKKFPGYGFAAHKGYGTELHRKALKRKGPSPHHRLTFIRNFTTIK